MKKILLILLSLPFVLHQVSLFGMNRQKTILIRVTDAVGPERVKYTLQVPYYQENKRTYVLFQDIYNEINRQHNRSDARLFTLLYYPDNKEGFVDYERGRVFLNTKSLDDIFVVKSDDNV